VIEVDGGQHYEQTGRENDEWRTQALNQAGICVVRFSNSDVDHHFNEVCASILAVLKMEDSRP
jgi:very-short-patch-repair endonuclease